MDPKRDEMAMLRFSLIAPAVNGTYTEPSKAAYYRAVSGRLVALPDGGEARFSPGTLAHWEWRYRHEGFEGLVGAARSDSGSTRSLTAQQRAELDAMRRRLPRMSATQARLRMIEEGLMEEGDASVSTFQRYFRNNPVAPAGAPPARDRRAFEAERPNQLWQADTLYGPYAALGGGRRGRAYLQMVIDDRSRAIVGGRFWPSDNAANFQRVLRGAVATWGLPEGLYVDNGGPYRNDQLSGICGRLGVVLSHAPARDGAAKGKVERNFRTLRTRLLDCLEPDPARTLEQLNDLLAAYVARHNSTPHSALGGRTPAEVWDEGARDAPPRRPPDEAWLDECFRNRERRRVNNDSTVRVRGVLYDVPAHLIGGHVELCFTPDDPSDMWGLDERGDRFPLRPTDKAANGRSPREAPRYRVDWCGGEES